MRLPRFFIQTAALAMLFCGTVQASPQEISVNPHAALPCSSCHKATPPAAKDITNETCAACHGSYTDLAPKTDRWGNRNPHDNHRGEIACTACHGNHKASEFMCNECHSFDDMNEVFTKSAR